MSWNLFISLTQRDISIEERYCYPEQKVIHLALIFSKDIKARSEIAKSTLIISISLWGPERFSLLAALFRRKEWMYIAYIHAILLNEYSTYTIHYNCYLLHTYIQSEKKNLAAYYNFYW